jgi:hypothetical protein
MTEPFVRSARRVRPVISPYYTQLFRAFGSVYSGEDVIAETERDAGGANLQSVFPEGNGVMP